MRSAWVALALAFGLAGCADPIEDRQSFEAPTYEAVSLEGEPVSLASLRGSAVLLNVWATWCTPCREEIPFLAQLHADEAANGLRVVGVSIDAARDHGKVVELAPRMGVTYEIWLDPDERIAGVMRYGGVPASMLIDREGVVRWKHVGVVRATTPGFAAALSDVLEPAHGD